MNMEGIIVVELRSNMIKKGFDRVLYCSLLCVVGVKEEDFGKLFIVVVNLYIDIVLGYVYL